MSDPQIQMLLNRFAESAIKSDEGVFSSGRKARVYAEINIQTWRDIKKIGEPAKIAMMELLKHEDPSVRTSAAACLLKFAHKEARAVLEEAAKHEGLVAFEAEQCLERWEEGEWHLDD